MSFAFRQLYSHYVWSIYNTFSPLPSFRSVAEVIPEPPVAQAPAEAPKEQQQQPAAAAAAGEAPKAEPEVDSPASEEQKEQPKEEAAKPAAEEATPVKQTAPVAATPVDTHELLVCTEEQVRIIALPSLKTKHKYRFWEKAMPASANATPKPAATKPASKPVEEQQQVAEQPAEAKEAPAEPAQPAEEGEKPKAAVEELEAAGEHEKPATSATAAAPSLRRVAAFGLQQFPPACEEWHAVLALKNGRINVLTIPGLRRLLKGKPSSQLNPINKRDNFPEYISQWFSISLNRQRSILTDQ